MKFPYERFRPGQREVAEAVRKTVEEGSLLLLQAPTGFGKTAAVIYGLLLAKADKVLYVVRTRNEISPVARELFRFGVEYTFLFSARRMCPLLAGKAERIPVEEFWENCKIARLKGACTYYNALATASIKTIKSIIEDAQGNPFRAVKMLASYGYCPFFALEMLVGTVNFVIATYPYLFKREIFEAVFDPLTYKDFVIVVDEAHSMIDLASMFEVRLTERDVMAALKELKEYVSEAEELIRSLKQLLEYMKKLQPTQSLKRVDKKKLVQMLGDYEVWDDVAIQVRLERAKKALEEWKPDNITSMKVHLSKIAWFARELAQQSSGAYVYSSGGSKGITVIPFDLSERVSPPLEESKAAILMSGTLPPHTYYRDVLGITRRISVYDVELVHGYSLSSNYYCIVLVEVTSRYTERSSHTYKRYADYILLTFNHVKGTLLVVYPSYEFMHKVVENLSKTISKDKMIVEDKNTSISDVVDKVLEDEHVLLNTVAGGKLTEGVELVKDGKSLINAVFIAGVPYPQPDDYVEDVALNLTRKLGAEARNTYFNTIACIRTRQALGRALRSSRDRSLYILADRRFLSRSIRSQLRVRIDRIVSSIDSYAKVLEKVKPFLEV